MAQAAKQSPVYVTYWLYQLDQAFTRLPEEAQRAGKAAFLAALEHRDKRVTVRGVYSLVGLRGNADLMLWVLGPDLDAIQRLAVALRQTGLGRYLNQVETYVGVTTPARYDPEHQAAFAAGAPPKRYVSVYPFVKTTEWFLLPFEERRDLMAEHGLVGRKYAVPRERLVPATPPTRAGRNGKGGAATATKPAAAAVATAEQEGGGVLSNTVDAFGLGDYEFILANEADDPSELAAMMMALRATRVRRYTKLDTPIFLGRLREPAEALEDL